MSSEEIPLQNGLNVFQDDPLRAFNCGPTRPGPKTRELAGFMDEKIFSFPSSQGNEFRGGNIYNADDGSERPDPSELRNWVSGDESDGDDEDDDEDDEDGEDDDGDGEENNREIGVNINGHNINGNSNTGSVTVHCSTPNLNPEKVGNGNAKQHSPFGGASREVVVKDSVNVAQTSRESGYHNEVTVAQRIGEMYYLQCLQGGDGSGCGGAGQKEVIAENGSSCGISGSGRKEGSFSKGSGDSLQAILSDPITGALMDDAMILPCGHSFTAAGIQHVLRMKACYTCSQPASEDLVAPNLSLRAAVQAFRREEEMQIYRSSKRRRERYEQDKSGHGDPNLMDNSRGRGVQFPFAVMDRVIIKGNKRTPPRFVGREAVVTTQCLNGWYVVKTLDNAESVKLQYRSLAKVTDDRSSKAMSSKMGPNWL